MSYQSLYRRYRPRRFSEVRGQDHVITALRNAVRGGTEGHAYLFSGPRGTGKTSTARILAKALNCEHPVDGEPDCECDSCLEIEAGRSFDLFELDAASNNGVDSVRDLIERSVVASPGRTKVYILDEVHMLSTAASNALLKTLEEPPDHVRFVLATTDPQKVLPTIRSRTQHFEFQLLSSHELTDYVRWIADDAGLTVDDEAVAHVVRQGRGSARDTLSALDQVIAAGGVLIRSEPVDALLEAMSSRHSGAAIAAVADALAQGHDPRVLGDALLGVLRDAFLMSLDVDVPHLVDADRERIGDWARRLGTPTLTRSIETLGSALVDMRQAADPRVPLEVALVRLTTASGGSIAELEERIERLERVVASGAVSSGGAGVSGAGAATADEVDAVSGAPAESATVPDEVLAREVVAGSAAAERPSQSGSSDGPARARQALRDARARSDADGSKAGEPTPSTPAKPPASEPAPSAGAPPSGAPSSGTARPAAPKAPRAPRRPAPAAHGVPDERVSVDTTVDPSPSDGGGDLPDRDSLVIAFADAVVPTLKGMAKAIYTNGRFVAVTGRGAVFALDNAPTLERAEKHRAVVEAALAAHFGRPVPLILIDQAAAHEYEGTAAGAGSPTTKTPPPAAIPTDTPPAPAPTPEPAAETDDEPAIDVNELTDATDVALSGIDKLTQAFPGAVLVEGDEAVR